MLMLMMTTTTMAALMVIGKEVGVDHQKESIRCRRLSRQRRQMCLQDVAGLHQFEGWSDGVMEKAGSSLVSKSCNHRCSDERQVPHRRDPEIREDKALGIGSRYAHMDCLNY